MESWFPKGNCSEGIQSCYFLSNGKILWMYLTVKPKVWMLVLDVSVQCPISDPLRALKLGLLPFPCAIPTKDLFSNTSEPEIPGEENVAEIQL